MTKCHHFFGGGACGTFADSVCRWSSRVPWRSSRDALVKALTWDRILERDAKTERLFKPLFEKQSLAAIRALAAEERTRQDLP